MSSSLQMYPVIPQEGEYLDNSLKYALQRRTGGVACLTLSHEDMPYLRGLLDAGIADAQKVIDNIETYGAVSLREEF